MVDFHDLLHGALSRNAEGRYSASSAAGDGVEVTFIFSFVGTGKAYIREADIHVFLRDSDPASATYQQYTEILDELLFPTDNSVTLTTVVDAPTDGENNILIRRIMPKGATYANTETDAIFRKEVLNNSFLQSLYVVHEALDGFLGDNVNLLTEVDNLNSRVDNCLRVSNLDEVSPEGLILPVNRANKFITFDISGNAVMTDIVGAVGSSIYVEDSLRTAIASLTLVDGDTVTVRGRDTKYSNGYATYNVVNLTDYLANSVLTAPDGEELNGVLVGADFVLTRDANIVLTLVQNMFSIDVYQFGYRGIGVIDNGADVTATPDASQHESDVLDKIYAYIERGASQDIGASSAGIEEFIQKGRYNVTFPSRSICNVIRPFPYFANRCNIDFNNTEIRPTAPFVVLSEFSFNARFSQITINYEKFNTDEEVYEAHLAGTDANGIEIMQFETAAIAFPLESFTHYDQCYIVGGWEPFKGAREGILFGIKFSGCKAVNPLSYGFNIGDTTNISTTCVLEQPFVRLTKRDTTQHNGYVWRALQHMGAGEPQTPPAVPVSSEYWQIGLNGDGTPQVPSTQAAWVTAKFYRAFGKHYRLINMSTQSLISPSADGGTDQSPTIVLSGIDFSINHFHLEKHQKVFSDRPTISIISGAVTFGTLYLAECQITNEGNSVVRRGGLLFSCRVGHLSDANNEALNGADWFDYWDKLGVAVGTETEWAIGVNYTTGDATFIKAANAGGRGITFDNLEQKGSIVKSGRIKAVDGENTNEGRLILGKGIPRGLMKNMRGQQSLRGIVTPPTYVEPLISILSTFTTRPRPEQNGTLFTTSLETTGVLTVQINGDAPVGTKYGFQVSNAATGTTLPSGSIQLASLNNSFFLNMTTVTNGTIWVEKTGSNEDGTAPNSWRSWTEGGADADGWVEFVPIGSYSSGTFTLPLSKTLADVAEIKLTAVVNIYYKTGYINLIDAGYSTGQFVVQENPVSNGSNSARLTFSGPTSVSAAIGTSGSVSPRLLSAYVKFK